MSEQRDSFEQRFAFGGCGGRGTVREFAGKMCRKQGQCCRRGADARGGSRSDRIARGGAGQSDRCGSFGAAVLGLCAEADLSAVEGAIKARVHTPGQAPPSPRLLLALWLYAVSEGVGSARALARLCEHHDAYRWLCGGVSMNYHGLSDFRVAHPELLDQLLIDNVAALSAAGIIDLDEVTQD